MKFVPVKVTRAAATAVLRTKQNSPVILFATGLVGFGATVVTASKATLRVEGILDEADKTRATIDTALASPKYNEDDKKHDLWVVKKDVTLALAKNYALPIALGVGTVFCFTQAHRIQARRIAGLSAALHIVQAAFEQYRERVREELGDEKDRQFYYGVEKEEISIPTADGTKKKTVKNAAGLSGYARYFDESNVNWQRDPMANETFLRAQQEYANRKLNAHGYIFLNDIYEALGYERTTAGQLVGWLRKSGGGKDGYVDFGLGEWPTAQDWAYGREKSVLLDFNPDGEIHRLLNEKE